MISEIYRYVLARRLGRHCETQYIIPIFPANTTLRFTITPAEGIYGMIVWLFSFGDILANIFQAESWLMSRAGGGLSQHSVLIDPWVIANGVPTWLYLTKDEPLFLNVSNTDSFAHYFQCVMWHVDVMTKEDLATIEAEIKELGLPAAKTAELIARELTSLILPIPRAIS